MRFFLDTEFIEDGKTIDLLSIGIVAEDGREFYQCKLDAKLNKASDWVIWNVYPTLGVSYNGECWYWNEREKQDSTMRWEPAAVVVPRSEIRERVRKFLGTTPEIWGYYADYDWVVFCQLFGRMVDLPKGYPMYCRDLKQCYDSMRFKPNWPEQKNLHNALADAHWARDLYKAIVKA